MTRFIPLAALVVLGAAACASVSNESTPPGTPGAAGTGSAVAVRDSVFPTWTVKIEPATRASHVRGEASLRALPGDRTYVSVTVAGGDPAAWDLRSGRCGEDGAVVGDADDYPPLGEGTAGRLEARSTLDAALDPDADYRVEVLGGTGSVVACGEAWLEEPTTE